MELVASNFVIVAPALSPKLYSQTWLQKNEILAAEEIENSIINDSLIQVTTSQFVFLLTDGTLQFHVRTDRRHDVDVVQPRLAKFVESMPLPEWKAIGINFIWRYVPDVEVQPGFSRRLFGADVVKGSIFDTDDAQFGWYASRNIDGFRMRMDIKPAHFVEVEGSPQMTESDRGQLRGLLATFNFHHDFDSASDQSSVVQALDHRLEFEMLSKEAFLATVGGNVNA